MKRTPGTRAWRALLLVPYAGVLWTPLYGKAEPAWFGVPFFYWYQMAWIPLSAMIIAIVYFKSGDRAADKS